MAKQRKAKTPEPIADDRILDPSELLSRIPLDRSTIWRLVQDGKFPAPIRLTPSRIGWRWSAVLDWLNDRERHPVQAPSYFGRDKDTPAVAD